jgi:hypothetical protein
MKMKPRSELHRQRIKEALTGKPKSPESRAKISASHLKRWEKIRADREELEKLRAQVGQSGQKTN